MESTTMISEKPSEKLLEKSVRVHWHLSLSITILKKLGVLKPTPNFADELNLKKMELLEKTV